MTIAITVKVNDGVVLASDSASTIVQRGTGGPPPVVNVYDNANKIFNLRKGLPIGAVVWGAGSLGSASISTLAKDLRRRFAGDDGQHPDWALDPASYSMADVAARVRQFIYEEHYVPAHRDWPEKPAFGMFVVGYSAGDGLAEQYEISVNAGDGSCDPPKEIYPVTSSGTVVWRGQPDPVTRLLLGVGYDFPAVLRDITGADPSAIDALLDTVLLRMRAGLVNSAMPIQDALDLAEFLVYVTIQFFRFSGPHPIVGGPIELAAITKHEGFKWVRRKHYYSPALNPPEAGGTG